jgi:hypothetical protein
MPKFLIEVRHEPEVVACAKVVRVFLTSGSHFLSNAEWGCEDGDHRAWMMVDAANRAEANAIVPPAFRPNTTIVGLNRFHLEQIDAILKMHNVEPRDYR